MKILKKSLLGAFIALAFGSMVFAQGTPAETRAEELLSIVNQIITQSETPDSTKESIKTIFIGCSLNHKDDLIKESCGIVLKMMDGEYKKQEAQQENNNKAESWYSIRQYKLEEVVDGDTIKIQDNNGDIKSVRLIGIDAPESNTARYGYIECFGEEASYHLKEILDGNDYIQIEFDPSQGSYDKYGRLLGYLILNGENINKQMIKDGYAFEYTYNLPYKYRSDFNETEKDARWNKRGLWEKATCNGKRGEINTTNNINKNSYNSNSYNSSSSVTKYEGSDGRTYIRGPRGGCYYINSNGNKSYVSRSLCSEPEKPNSSYETNSYNRYNSYSDHSYIRGPRGGCYYYTSGGKKRYVSRSLCD